MDLSAPKHLRSALHLAGLHPHKKLDQHFLVDKNALNLIIKTADLKPTDTILEIGPGPGVLTTELAQHAKKVVAVELDSAYAEILTRQSLDNITVINEDIQKYDLTKLPKGYKVVANLPYSITSRILRQLLASDNKPASLTVLVQKEVAARITARAGALSILALSVQYFGTPELIAVVPKHSFYPAPKVDSAILQVRTFNKPPVVGDEQELFRLIKIGFSARRKMLKNNLSAGLHQPMAEVELAIKKASIIKTARAQELSLADWSRLLKALQPPAKASKKS